MSIFMICVLLLHVNSASGRGLKVGDDKDSWVKMSGIDKSVPYQKIYVDQPGQNGNFSTIQSAIDSVTSNNPNWVVIHIKEGTYRYIYTHHKGTRR